MKLDNKFRWRENKDTNKNENVADGDGGDDHCFADRQKRTAIVLNKKPNSKLKMDSGKHKRNKRQNNNETTN